MSYFCKKKQVQISFDMHNTFLLSLGREIKVSEGLSCSQYAFIAYASVPLG